MKVKGIIIAAIVVLLLVFIKFQFLSSNSGVDPKKAKSPAPPSAVKVFVVKREMFSENIMTTGTAVANEEADLKPEISGKVVKIYFVEGSLVQEGKLLVKINDADLQAQLQKTMLQIQLAEEKEARQKKMLDINGVSKEEYDVLVNEVNTLKADRAYLYAQIRKTEIRAPFTGVVGLRSISEGTFVSPSTIVANMQQLTPLKIDFSIPEKYADLLTKGDVLYFQTEGIDKSFKARVFAIEPKIDLATRTLKVRALSYEHQNKILPGSFVKINIAKNRLNSLLIPTEALVPELKGHKIYFYRNGKAIPAKVIAGTRTETKVLIREGIEEGDTIITSGMMQLKPEASVKIIEVIQ
jgi:membrane fusion protein, multidrug efflux system